MPARCPEYFSSPHLGAPRCTTPNSLKISSPHTQLFFNSRTQNPELGIRVSTRLLPDLLRLHEVSALVYACILHKTKFVCLESPAVQLQHVPAEPIYHTDISLFCVPEVSRDLSCYIAESGQARGTKTPLGLPLFALLVPKLASGGDSTAVSLPVRPRRPVWVSGLHSV